MTEASIRFARRVHVKDASLRTRMLDIAAGLADVITLGRGDPDLPTPAHVVEAGRKALADGATHYTHPAGLPQLRAAIAAGLARDHGLDYAADEIIVTAGGQEAVYLAMQAFIDPGDEVLLPAPGYTSYDHCVELAGGVPVPVPVGAAQDFAFTADAVEKRITPKTRMLCLINPANPTGAVTPETEVRKLAALAVKHDLIVISDEIYARLVYDNHRVLSVAAIPGMKERTITINGFSKTYAMTGWRIGYLAVPKAMVPALAEIHHVLAICAPAVSQHAALAAVSGPQDAVEAMRRTYDERRKALCAALDRMKIRYGRPGGAFYVYADVSSTGLAATEFCVRLLQEAKVMMFPGSLYGDPTDDHVRISLLAPLPRVEEAMRRMGSFIAALKR